MVAFVQVYPSSLLKLLYGNSESQVTEDGKNAVLNGIPDWVYERKIQLQPGIGVQRRQYDGCMYASTNRDTLLLLPLFTGRSPHLRRFDDYQAINLQVSENGISQFEGEAARSTQVAYHYAAASGCRRIPYIIHFFQRCRQTGHHDAERHQVASTFIRQSPATIPQTGGTRQIASSHQRRCFR